MNYNDMTQRLNAVRKEIRLNVPHLKAQDDLTKTMLLRCIDVMESNREPFEKGALVWFIMGNLKQQCGQIEHDHRMNQFPSGGVVNPKYSLPLPTSPQPQK